MTPESRAQMEIHSSPVGQRLSAERLLGLLAHTMGNLDQAVSHFDDRLAFCGYADAPHQRIGEGDEAKAMSLLDESLAITSELGMRPLMERVRSRREILRA